MQLKDFDFKGLFLQSLKVTDPKTDTTFKLLKKYPEFLDHLQAKLMTYDKPNTIEQFLGILSEDDKYALALIATYPYNRFTLIKQIENPRVSSAVPILLSALKEKWGIPYSFWNTEAAHGGNYLKAALGYSLYSAFTEDKIEYTGDILELRKNATAGKAATAYNIIKSGDVDFDKQSKFLRHMLLQTWLFHPSVRHPNMILDIKDWSNKPPALADLDVMPRVKSEVAVGEGLPW